jgi:hypothetical protein
VFFAEVISGSMRYPLFDIWGYITVIPLYGLHTILLLTIIRGSIKNKKILFSTLYFGGVLFGLYEAYITKVLFVGLADDAFMVLNIPIFDYIVLVFFWHPIFSFIIPTLVFEKLIARSNYVYQGLPGFIKNLLSKKYGLVFIMILVGLFSAFNGRFDSLTLSELSLVVPILLIIFILYKKGINNQFTLDEILPNKKGIIFSSIYLFGIYFMLGVFFLPEVLTLENQIPIWISYIIFGFLFYLKIVANKQVEESLIQTSVVTYNRVLIYTAIIMISGIVFVLLFWLLGIQEIALVTTWILWILTGLYMLIYSLFYQKKTTKSI